MKCFRCDGLDFDVSVYSLFGNAVLECFNCSQQFFVIDKLDLVPVELIGTPKNIEQECIIIKCNFCPTKRYISDDCTNLNMQSCGFCNYETKPFGDKIPLAEFLNRSNELN